MTPQGQSSYTIGRWTQRILNASLSLSLACTDASGSHVPELGTYVFAAEWDHPDFVNEIASASGELNITSASESEIQYTFTVNGVAKSGTARWDDLNDWLVISGAIPLAGMWTLLPHLERTNDGYRCYGNAFRTQSGGEAMTCSFTYQGP